MLRAKKHALKLLHSDVKSELTRSYGNVYTKQTYRSLSSNDQNPAANLNQQLM